MTEICRGMDNRYRRVAEEQDAIGWRKFMEGMICCVLRGLQEIYTTIEGSNVTGEQWATGVIIKLLETTHGQWLYRCVQVHDRFSGIQATQQEEELQRAIEAQQEMGWEDMTEEDQYLAEVNLEDLEHTSGEQQEYWLVAIQAAREASRLQGLSQSNVGRRRTARRGRAHTQL
jgi:bifunctional N-acetylglucosamine-1-phosphate-uridyltransferase/glucosamine-1-phosphate-acetyltransferase GlmU-like protein